MRRRSIPFFIIFGLSLTLISASAFAEEVEIIHLVTKYITFSIVKPSSTGSDYAAWDQMMNGDQYARERQTAAIKEIAGQYCRDNGFVSLSSVSHTEPTEDTSERSRSEQEWAEAFSGTRYTHYNTILTSVRCFRDGSKDAKETSKVEKDVASKSSPAASDTSSAEAGSAPLAAAAR